MGAMSRHSETRTLTIAASASASSAFPVRDFASGAVQLPATMTGSAITVQTSNDGSTWASCRDVAGAAKGNITIAASITVPIHSEAFAGKFLRFLSNGTEASERSLLVVCKG